MIACVKKYIAHHLVCIERKSNSGPKQGLLHPIGKTPIPVHTIHLDCTGPFIETPDSYKHILLILDGFTNFCLLKPYSYNLRYNNHFRYTFFSHN